jgi:MFS family permease
MRGRFANPWWVVAGAVAGLSVCNGPVLFFTSGVFLKPVVAGMQWRRATVSFALSLGVFLGAVAVPFLGRMMDRWGIRRVALPGLALFAICMGMVALTPRSPAAFMLFFALAGVMSAVQAPLPYAKAISAWFDEGPASPLASRWRGSGWERSSCRRRHAC